MREFTSDECMAIAHNQIEVRVGEEFLPYFEQNNLGVIIVVVDKVTGNAGWVAGMTDSEVTMTLSGILAKKVN